MLVSLLPSSRVPSSKNKWSEASPAPFRERKVSFGGREAPFGFDVIGLDSVKLVFCFATPIFLPVATQPQPRSFTFSNLLDCFLSVEDRHLRIEWLSSRLFVFLLCRRPQFNVVPRATRKKKDEREEEEEETKEDRGKKTRDEIEATTKRCRPDFFRPDSRASPAHRSLDFRSV